MYVHKRKKNIIFHSKKQTVFSLRKMRFLNSDKFLSEFNRMIVNIFIISVLN